jgi:hypothetical protein
MAASAVSTSAPACSTPRSACAAFTASGGAVAGQAMVKSVPSASMSASATGPILPQGVESKVEQYLK